LALVLLASLEASVDVPSTEAQKQEVGRCDGVDLRPDMNIQAAINARGPGTTFCFRPGIYRLTKPLVPKDRQRFISVGRSVLSGAKPLTSFEHSGPYWIAHGQTQQHPTNPQGVCRPETYTGCMYAEGVFIDDRNLWQVTSLSELAPGSFYFDYAADAIYLADDPSGHDVEASIAQAAFGFSAARGVEIRGFLVEKFANPAKYAAVGSFGAKHWLIVGNELRLNHGMGICAGSRSVVRENHVHDQGQLGFCGSGRDGVFERNEVAFNNTEGFDWRWEAGGAKWIGTTDLVVRMNQFHDNTGHALWTDTGNVGTLYQRNRIRRNAGAGIYHESSGSATIRANVVVGNGYLADGWDRAGILVGASRNVAIIDNVLRGNGWGIFAKQHGSPPPLVEGIRVIANTIVMCEGYTGIELDQGVDAPRVFRRGVNRFEDNRYQVGSGDVWWRWRQEARTWREWRRLGHDRHGRIRGIDC
jgi:parallel beta-helix repeat protein